jgi:hypothetical protein
MRSLTSSRRGGSFALARFSPLIQMNFIPKGRGVASPNDTHQPNDDRHG